MTRTIKTLAALPALIAASPAWAQVQEAAPTQVLSDSGDNGWMLAAAVIGLLVLLPGTALVAAGRLEAGQRASPIIQTLTAVCVGGLLWVLVGYSLTFAPGSAWLGGFSNTFMGNMGEIRSDSTVHEASFALFQMVFALLGPALVVAAVADRARALWVALFSLLWVVLVHIPLMRWTSAGWLAEIGAEDFAGGFSVQIAGGVSALVAALMLGRRKAALPENDSVTTMAGAALMLVGSLALVGGAAMGAGPIAASAIFNTLIAAAASGLLWMFIGRSGTDGQGTRLAMGIIAGTAAMAPAAGLVGTIGALVIGIVAGLVSRAALSMVRNKLKIDDLSGVFAVHGVAAMVGALLLAIFIAPGMGGVNYVEGMGLGSQLVAQLVAIGVTILWAIVGTLIAGYAAAVVSPIRRGE